MKVDLEVRSPVHIGNTDEGGEQTRFTDELAVEGKKVYVPDIDAYFRDNPHRIDDFVAGVEQDYSPGALLESVEDYPRYTLDNWVDTDDLRSDVSEFTTCIKTGHDRPYIPGTTLKGFIRTALAYYALVQKPEHQRRITEDDEVRDLFRLSEDDPMHDVMRCLTIRDSTPPESDALCLINVKTHSKQGYEMEEKFWDDYREALKPGVTLETELKVNVPELRRMTDEFGEREKVDALFGPELSDEAIHDRIETAVDRFTTEIMAEEQQLTGKFDRVEQFYQGLNEDGTYLRLGAFTNWYSKTIGLALPERERQYVWVKTADELPHFKHFMTHLGCGGPLVPDDRNPGKFFCIECYTGGIEPASGEVSGHVFPKTRRIANYQGRPSLPMGWVRAEFGR